MLIHVAVILPSPISQALNSAFSPPATYSDTYGAYVVPCEAVAPEDLQIKIGGGAVAINPQDLIINLGGVCISGVSDYSGVNFAVLGSVFLKK